MNNTLLSVLFPILSGGKDSKDIERVVLEAPNDQGEICR